MFNLSNQNKLLLALAMLGLSTLFCTMLGGDGGTNGVLSATLNEKFGVVQVLNQAADGALTEARNGQQIVENDQVITFDDGRARLDLSNGTIVRIGPLTAFTLQSLEDREDGAYTLLDLEIGELWIILNGGSLEVDTPSGLASVRGSYMQVRVHQGTNQVWITCLEGTCQIGNNGGTIAITAGQTAMIINADTKPEAGLMDHADIEAWLQNNPEATLVVVPLTRIAPASDTPMPELPTPTGTACSVPQGWTLIQVGEAENIISLAASHGVTPQELADGNCLDLFAKLEVGAVLYAPPITPTPTATQGPIFGIGTPTITATGFNCGPPEDWVIYTVKAGETLEGLAGAWGVEVSTLQQANCLGDSTVIVENQPLFVPNEPTRTPTVTITPLKTPVPTATKSGNGDNSDTEFSDILGPENDEELDECVNLYRVYVEDPDGIDKVEIEYAINDEEMDDPERLELDFVTTYDDGRSKYRKKYSIDTSDAGDDIVYWRFVATDKDDNETYYPSLDDDPYSFEDKLECESSGNSRADEYFTNITGPTGTGVSACTQEYSVHVYEPDGVYFVKVVYSTNDNDFNDGLPYDDEFLLNLNGGDETDGTWKRAFSISSAGGTTIYYRFVVRDKENNTKNSDIYSFDYATTCP